MNNPLLDKLGEILMKQVRDKAIGDWERIVTGQMRGASAERIRQHLACLSPQQTDLLLKLIPQIVDTTLHHLLWTVEQEKSLDLMLKDEQAVAHSAQGASDGLPGELYGDQGWIARFSAKSKDHI